MVVPAPDCDFCYLPLANNKTMRLQVPKNSFQIDLSEQDILHIIEFDPAQLQQLEKLSTQELANFRFVLPFGEYMFEEPNLYFIKQAVKDNALRIEYYDPFEDIIVIRSGEGDSNSCKLIEIDP
jgi:hypothetical protein